MLVIERELGGEDAGIGKLLAQPQCGELAHRVGLQIDAQPQRLELRHRFIDAAVDADLVQAERGGEPRDAAADDDHLHFPDILPSRATDRRHTGRPLCCSAPTNSGFSSNGASIRSRAAAFNRAAFARGGYVSRRRRLKRVPVN